MATDDVPMDDKANRMRDLLSSFYSTDHSSSGPNPAAGTAKFATLDTINTASFNPNLYMNLLLKKSNLETLLQRHVEMAAVIKNLDMDLQMLVYENYSKFMSATETIKRYHLSYQRVMGVNTLMFEKRGHIEKLHQTRNILCKIQGKIFSDSESFQGRIEAVMLLKQLDFAVETLKEQLLEKLEQSLGELQLSFEEVTLSSASPAERLRRKSSDFGTTAHEFHFMHFSRLSVRTM